MISDMTNGAEPLPQPNGAFEWVQVRGRWALVCRSLSPLADHFFTTRFWPLGAGAEHNVAEGWDSVASALDLRAPNLVRLQQVHGADVVVASGPSAVPEPADIVVTGDRSIALAVQAADCVPLLLADARSGAVAAAHAGWRGLAANVPAMAVRALSREFGSRPSDLVVAVGPSIGPCCYEVGDDVRERFERGGLGVAAGGWFLARTEVTERNPSVLDSRGGVEPGRRVFDTWRATRALLEAAGVESDRIFEAGLCTASHPALCSYRRDGSRAGRIVAAIRSRPLRPWPGSPGDLHER
jgi:YfiH family protein